MWSELALDRVHHNIELYIKKMEEEDNNTTETISSITTDSEFTNKSDEENEQEEEEYDVYVKHNEKRLKKPKEQEQTYFTNII